MYINKPSVTKIEAADKINLLHSTSRRFGQYSLTKLMVSHDFLRSTVTNQIAFNQRDSKSISNFERAMDRCCQALVSRFFLVSKLETMDTN